MRSLDSTPLHAKGRRILSATVLAAAAVSGCSDGVGPEDSIPDDGGQATTFDTRPRPAYSGIRHQWIGSVDPTGTGFTAGRDHILEDGQPFELRGVVYVPSYPGYLPWEIEVATDQTLWIDPETDDLHDPAFKQSTRAYFRSVIDRIHAAFPDGATPLVAYLVGNEISASTILATNAAHPDLDRFEGNRVRAGPGLNATEVFLAEMADYVKEYEQNRYGVTRLVSYSNDIRTADLIDTAFLDFRSHNVYSYAVHEWRPGTPWPGWSSTSSSMPGGSSGWRTP